MLQKCVFVFGEIDSGGGNAKKKTTFLYSGHWRAQVPPVQLKVIFTYKQRDFFGVQTINVLQAKATFLRTGGARNRPKNLAACAARKTLPPARNAALFLCCANSLVTGGYKPRPYEIGLAKPFYM